MYLFSIFFLFSALKKYGMLGNAIIKKYKIETKKDEEKRHYERDGKKSGDLENIHYIGMPLSA